MLYLARKEYPDRRMSDEDLDAVVDLWRAWYEEKRWAASSAGKAYQLLEIRLWGFAQDRGPELLNLLRQGLASHDLPEASVELSDPDTVTVVVPPVPLAKFL